MCHFFYWFSFGEYFTIIDFLGNMKTYISDILEVYKDTIIGKRRHRILVASNSAVLKSMCSWLR